jgi:hypothetical protein
MRREYNEKVFPIHTPSIVDEASVWVLSTLALNLFQSEPIPYWAHSL